MRSFSIHVGRLFGVDVRLHLTFLILPLFVFWTEYNAQHPANGPRDLALVGIVLACVAAHEIGHMFMARRAGLVAKAVILLPLSGVTVFDESRMREARARRRGVEAGSSPCSDWATGESCIRHGGGGCGLRCRSRSEFVEVAFSSVEQPAAQLGVGESITLPE